MLSRTISRYWLWGWAALAVLLLALALATTVSGSSSYSSARQDAQARDTFYREVAVGGDSGGQYPVTDHLASDIHALLGKVDPKASHLPNGVAAFYGDPNAYGGISSELGMNPFARSSSCFECGPLSSTVKANILKIKQGRLDSVIAAEQPKKPASTLVWWALFLIALVAGPAVWLSRHLGSGRRLRREYPQECYLIDQLDGIIAGLPEGQADKRVELEKLRGQLQAITRGAESLHAQTVVQQAQLQVAARQAADKELEAQGLQA